MKNNKYLRRLLHLVLVCTVVLGYVAAVRFVDTPASAANGVMQKIQQILAVYPSGSHFTTDGKEWTSNTGANCTLSNIPSRGGLSSGAEASNACGDGASCNAFAKYVFFNIFKNTESIASQSIKITSVSALSVGDYVVFSGHYGIFLSYDSNYVYVYDSNFTTPPTNRVSYNTAVPRSRFHYGYHSNNYQLINGSAVAPGDSSVIPDNSSSVPSPETIVHVDYPAENASGQEYMEVSGWVAANSPISYLMMQIQGYENGNGGQINLSLHDSPGEAAGFTQTYFKRFRGVIETKYLTINQWYEYLIFNNDIPISHTGSFKYTGVHTPPSRSIINVDYPSGHYDEYNHIELKGWIVANEPISYVMAEIVGVTQYDMDFWDYPQLANAYPGYAYYKQFYTVIDINLLDSDQIYTLYVWTSVGDGVYTKTFTTGDVEPDNYTVNFNANEGENVPDSISVASGESFTVPDEVPTRAGYNFLGWSANESVEVAKYFPGDVITPDCHYELYAVWEVAPFAFNAAADIANVELESENGYVKFKAGALSVSDIKSLFSNTDISVYNNKGNALTSGIVGTGATVTSVVDGSSYTLTVVVLGDIDGNGLINSRDQNAIQNAVAGTGETFEGAYLLAADVVAPFNGYPNARDVNVVAGFISGITAEFSVSSV